MGPSKKNSDGQNHSQKPNHASQQHPTAHGGAQYPPHNHHQASHPQGGLPESRLGVESQQHLEQVSRHGGFTDPRNFANVQHQSHPVQQQMHPSQQQGHPGPRPVHPNHQSDEHFHWHEESGSRGKESSHRMRDTMRGSKGTKSSIKQGFKGFFSYSDSYGDSWDDGGSQDMEAVLKHNEFLQGEVATQTSLVDQLKKDLERERMIVGQVKQSADRMQLTLDNKEAFLGPQHSDDAIITEFRILFGQVKSWASANMAARSPGELRVGAKVYQPFGCICPCQPIDQIVSEIDKSTRQRRYFVRGCVAHELCTRLFRTAEEHAVSFATDVWLDASSATSFKQLESKLVVPASSVEAGPFHSWRAYTAELLAKRPSDDAETKRLEYLKQISQPILDAAGPWIPDEGLAEATQQLHTIFLDAVALSQLLRRQRASWSVRFLPTSTRLEFPADPEGRENPPSLLAATMKDIDDEDDVVQDKQNGTKPKSIRTFIEPGLFKRGNADGERYEVETCMVKTVVQTM